MLTAELISAWKNRICRTAFWRSAWPERVAVLAAMTGLLFSIFSGFHPRTWQGDASDFKTVYASAWCLAHHTNGYSFGPIGAVFAANGVIEPKSWFAHAPVYPPFTLVTLIPLTLLNMLHATYFWITLSAGVMAWAFMSLARAGKEDFGLSRLAVLIMIALCVAEPLLSFGLEMGNVSVVCAGLCIVAATARPDRETWWRAVGLAVALLLKPHLALWVVLGLLFFPREQGRRLALRSCVLAVGAVVAMVAWMAATHTLVPQLGSYIAIVHAETSGGSMAATNRELLGLEAQITSLTSLFGYGHIPAPVAAMVLVVLLAALIVASKRAPARGKLGMIAAWCAFGMIATYHRAHDGIVLLLVLPWLFGRLREDWSDAVAWCCLAAMGILSIGPSWDTLERLAANPAWHAFASFVLYRQAAFGALLMAAVLIGANAGMTWPARSTMYDAKPRRLRAIPDQRRRPPQWVP